MRVPHTLVLIFMMIIAAQALTYVVPHGEFERAEVDGHSRVVAGSYGPVDEVEHLVPWHLFTAIPRGFSAAANIIFFVFIVGGAFGILRASGASDALIGLMLSKLGHLPGWLIFGGMFVFAAGSSTIGMAEEYLPFVPMLLALAIGLGFDAVTAIGILCVGYGLGYGSAALNPFTVLVAQEVAELPPTSGWPFRIAMTAPLLLIGFHHVYSYAQRVKADPAKSLVADIEPDPAWAARKETAFTGRHLAILIAILGVLAAIVFGIQQYGWYLVELGAIFLGLSVLIPVLAGMSANRAAKEFCHGASELTTTAVLIGFARAIEVILTDGQIIDTVVHWVSLPLQQAGPYVAAVGMFFVQSVCNFFIPSGSGQAYVTMPLMAPLADVVGLTRQVAVLAYQMGDGFTNIMVPTNAVLVGILTMARIPFDRWLRFILPLMLKFWIVGSIFLIIAVAIGY